MRFYVVTDNDLEKLEATAYEVGLDRGSTEEKGGLLEARDECRAMEVYRDANGFFIKKEIRK